MNDYKKHGSFKNGIPVHDTIARVVSSLGPKVLQSCFINWMKLAQVDMLSEVIAIDRKSIRGSYDKKSKKSAIHMVSVFAANNRVVLGQVKTAEKSNEIKAIPALLDLLDIKGSIITIDAMGCQKKIAKKICDKEADYVIAVKGNQEHLLKLEKSSKKVIKAKHFKATLVTTYTEKILKLIY